MSAAQAEFMQRGFGGTSIESIAKAAQIAKGTVYLYFDTKEEVFRAVSQQFIAWFMGKARAAAAAPGPVEQRVAAVLDVKFGAIHALARKSAHGAELVSSSQGVSGDLYRKADREYVAVLAGLLAEHQLSMSADEGAWMIFRAAEGSELAKATTAEVRRRLAELARVMVRGLAR